MGDAHVPALHAALALALAARCGAATQMQVDETRSAAEQLLPDHHPVRRAVLTFATMWELWHRDGEQIRKQGEYLQDALGLALNPDAPAPRMVYGGAID